MAYIGNTNTTQAFIPAVDYFNGDGATVAFTLSRPVASVAQVQAVIENVPQNPGTAFTVSGNTITFDSAPPSGTSNIYVYYTSPITQVIQPGQGTVGTTQLGNITAINSTTTMALRTAGTTAVTIDASQNVGIGTSTMTSKLNIAGGITIGDYQNIGATSNSAGISLTGGSTTNNGGQINLRGGSFGTANAIEFIQGGTERMRIDSSGNVQIGTTSAIASARLSVQAATNALAIQCNNAASGQLFTNTSGTAAYNPILFYNNGTTFSLTGFIQSSGTSTIYSTSSDYRLKENVEPMVGALDKVAALKPVTYKWKADGSEGQGFIAHELQEVVPNCVTGEKDAVDEKGNPVYQGIDTSFLVATLTAAIQELKARIEVLEAK
jgi:hypothetical protein